MASADRAASGVPGTPASGESSGARETCSAAGRCGGEAARSVPPTVDPALPVLASAGLLPTLPAFACIVGPSRAPARSDEPPSPPPRA